MEQVLGWGVMTVKRETYAITDSRDVGDETGALVVDVYFSEVG